MMIPKLIHPAVCFKGANNENASDVRRQYEAVLKRNEQIAQRATSMAQQGTTNATPGQISMQGGQRLDVIA